jgi:hypothetical protein
MKLLLQSISPSESKRIFEEGTPETRKRKAIAAQIDKEYADAYFAELPIFVSSHSPSDIAKGISYKSLKKRKRRALNTRKRRSLSTRKHRKHRKH